MSSQSNNTHECLSALADGALDAAEFGAAMELLARDGQALATWRSYHVVGDVLRATELSVQAVDGGFAQRFRQRLQAERPQAAGERAQDAVTQPLAHPMRQAAGHPGAEPRPGRGSANDPQFRWKLVAGLASVTALAALSWSVLLPAVQQPAGPGASQLAQAGAPAASAGLVAVQGQGGLTPAGAQTVAVAGPGRQVMIRDPRLDQLLAAHKQFGGTSALQMPAGFLRNATFEEPSR